MRTLSYVYQIAILVSICMFSLTSAFAEEQAIFEGLIEPSEIINIGSPVAGVIEAVKVERSSSVEKDEPLVMLESSVEKAVVVKARTLVKLESELRLQKERLAFAERKLLRSEQLFSEDLISVEEHDEVKTELNLSRCRLEKTEEDRELAKLDLVRARAQLNLRTIRSPVAGVVVERFVSAGEFVHDKPLLRLAKMDPLRVEVILPATMLSKIKTGMTAEITPELQPEKQFKATVTIVDRLIDSASGTFGVRLTLPNPNHSLPGGLRCSVRFHTGPEVAEERDKNSTTDSKVANKAG